MIGASIYGFVDYKKTSRNKEFTNMYEEKNVTEPVAVVTGNKTEPAVKKEAANIQAVAKENKTLTKKTAVVKEEMNTSIKPIAEEEKMVTSEAKEIEKVSVNVPVSKTSSIEKKKRRLSTKLFSRGALDERYIEPKAKVKKD
jgi:hypothetical protein